MKIVKTALFVFIVLNSLFLVGCGDSDHSVAITDEDSGDNTGVGDDDNTAGSNDNNTGGGDDGITNKESGPKTEISYSATVVALKMQYSSDVETYDVVVANPKENSRVVTIE